MSKIPEDTGAAAVLTPLQAFNQQFYQLYARRKQYFENSITSGEVLLIIRSGSDLISCCGSEIKHYPVNGNNYHRLKALAHSALAASYSVQHMPLPEASALLKEYLQQLHNLTVPAAGEAVLIAIRQLLNSVTDNQVVTHQHIQHYADTLQPLFSKLITLSATDEVIQLYKQLRSICQRYDKAATNTFYIVFGGPQARSQELTKRVFSKWCSDSDELLVDNSHHVRYFEGAQTVADAVSLIATAMADRELAKTFLGSADGLEQDILGRAADNVIARYWPALKAGTLD